MEFVGFFSNFGWKVLGGAERVCNGERYPAGTSLRIRLHSGRMHTAR